MARSCPHALRQRPWRSDLPELASGTSDRDGAPGVDLSVVIPAFNEQQRLRTTLSSTLEYLSSRNSVSEVIVVDDGSDDATPAIAREFLEQGVTLIQHRSNRGKGAALRSGVQVSRGDWVLLCDADLSTPIEEIELLERRTSEADVIFGSRAVDQSRVLQRQPLYREWMGKTFNLIIRSLGLVTLRDTQCGFKLLRGDYARQLFALTTIDRFAYDVEICCLARRSGLQIVEQGVRWENSRESKVHAVWDSARMFRDVVALRWRLGSWKD